jgi:hypothetical protein
LYSPFTGERVSTLRRELIFKIDNVPQARPPTALTKADIVYLLPVDGGLSRIMAVFSSHIPPVVGPVRSSREEDIKLLRQFGRPAFAFSGAQPHPLPVVGTPDRRPMHRRLLPRNSRSPPTPLREDQPAAGQAPTRARPGISACSGRLRQAAR